MPDSDIAAFFTHEKQSLKYTHTHLICFQWKQCLVVVVYREDNEITTFPNTA